MKDHLKSSRLQQLSNGIKKKIFFFQRLPNKI